MPRPSVRRTLRRNSDVIARAAVTAAAVLGVVGVAAAFYLARQPGETDLAVIAVEPREAGRDLLAADAAAQLDQAVEGEADVLLVDAGEATAYRTSLGCPPGVTEFACQPEQQQARADAEEELGGILDAHRETGDIFAVLRRTAEQVSADPVDGDVEVILNVTGRHRDPDLDLTGEELPDRIDELSELVADREVMPASCDGWQVRLVAPTTAAPTVDRAREEALDRVLRDCGGELVESRVRWVADGREFPPLRAAETAEGQGRERIRFELGEALFDVESAELRPAAGGVIDEIAATIREHHEARHDVSVRVDGYADHTGPDDLNQRLSEQRAEAVADALFARTDLPAEAVDARGHGHIDGDAEGGQPQHRRVDVTVSVHQS